MGGDSSSFKTSISKFKGHISVPTIPEPAEKGRSVHFFTGGHRRGTRVFGRPSIGQDLI